MRFSQRHGYRKARTSIQSESMDQDLRTALWNVATIYFWLTIHYSDYWAEADSKIRKLWGPLWTNYFNQPVDDFWTGRPSDIRRFIKEQFLNSEWYIPYELIEEILIYCEDLYPDQSEKIQSFIEDCNAILQKHISAYRIVGHKIAPITGQENIGAIDRALATEQNSVRKHLDKALKHLSDKTDPDYNSSIIESIRALESKVKTLLNDNNILLNAGLLELAKRYKKYDLHPAFADIFRKLDGYTGDVARHAKREVKTSDQGNENKTVRQEEAIFILVSCSAFISYLSALEARNTHD